MIRLDLDRPNPPSLPPTESLAQTLTLWLRSPDFDRDREKVTSAIEQVLDKNPFTTLAVVFEPTADPRSLSASTLDAALRACFARPTYLDRFYAVQPGRPKAAKRLVALAPFSQRGDLAGWAEEIGELADVVWRGADECEPELEEYEYVA